MKNHLTEILCLFLVIVLLITKCNWSNDVDHAPKIDTVTVHDTIHRVDTVTEQTTVKAWYAKHDTVFIVNFDTIKISDNDCDSIRQTVAYNGDSSVQVTSLTHGRILRQIIDSRTVNTTTTIKLHPDPDRFTVYGHVSVSTASIGTGIIVARRRDMFGISEVFMPGMAVPCITYGVKLFGK